jgi:UDP-N-acetyl-D-galactosamine dehydrogenase
VRRTVGFDINALRFTELKNGFDRSGEVQLGELAEADIVFTDCIEELSYADFISLLFPRLLTVQTNRTSPPCSRLRRPSGGRLKRGYRGF